MGLALFPERPGGTVKRTYATIAIIALASVGTMLAQEGKAPAKRKAASSSSPASLAHGKEVFDKKCAVCHYADSDQKKIGPGLKGLSRRRTFSVNNNKVTDETLKSWVENGDSLMPPFKDVLEPAEIKDVIAYVKTL
jgi:cytochrome c